MARRRVGREESIQAVDSPHKKALIWMGQMIREGRKGCVVQRLLAALELCRVHR